MFHYAYETRHIPTGEYYRGIHHGELGDSYLGSGDRLMAKVRKHPRSEFKKCVVCVLQDRDEAYEFERRWVTPEVVADPLCLNITVGGKGVGSGEDHPMSGRKNPAAHFANVNQTGEANWHFGGTNSPETRKRISESLKGMFAGEKNPMFGRNHSEAAREKIRQRQIEAQRRRSIHLGRS